MKLSPWHCELAKRVAEGKKYGEISQEIKISQSRLSVLKANPLFQKQVEKYRKINDDGYEKSLNVFNTKAKEIAEEVCDIALGKSVPPQVKLQAAREVLDRLGFGHGARTDRREGEEEISFEQILKITKRKGMGVEDSIDSEIDSGAAMKDLDSDLLALDQEMDIESLEKVGNSGSMYSSEVTYSQAAPGG